MRVTVFGASGKVGRLTVDRLLDEGHEVTAYVRNPARLDRSRTGLSVVAGQLDDERALSYAISGADAVISALGPSLKRSARGTALTEGTRAIGVRRFIGLATPSIPDPSDARHWKHTVLPLMARTMFPGALTELTGMTAAVTGSGLDWTIARITNPTNRPALGRVRAGFLGHDKVGMAISRADVAEFLVGQLTGTTYLQAAPAISN
jgi:nucleoside-diphosphate-sugar epimerase